VIIKQNIQSYGFGIVQWLRQYYILLLLLLLLVVLYIILYFRILLHCIVQWVLQAMLPSACNFIVDVSCHCLTFSCHCFTLHISAYMAILKCVPFLHVVTLCIFLFVFFYSVFGNVQSVTTYKEGKNQRSRFLQEHENKNILHT
jgi:hypothetical protein